MREKRAEMEGLVEKEREKQKVVKLVTKSAPSKSLGESQLKSVQWC